MSPIIKAPNWRWKCRATNKLPLLFLKIKTVSRNTSINGILKSCWFSDAVKLHYQVSGHFPALQEFSFTILKVTSMLQHTYFLYWKGWTQTCHLCETTWLPLIKQGISSTVTTVFHSNWISEFTMWHRHLVFQNLTKIFHDLKSAMWGSMWYRSHC